VVESDGDGYLYPTRAVACAGERPEGANRPHEGVGGGRAERGRRRRGWGGV